METIDLLKVLFDKIEALPEPKENPPFEDCLKLMDEFIAMAEEEVPKYSYETALYYNKLNGPVERFKSISWIFLKAIEPPDSIWKTQCDKHWLEYTFRIYKKELLSNVMAFGYGLAEKKKLLSLRA